VSNTDDKTAHMAEFERLRLFKQDYDEAITAMIRAAARESEVRRVAHEKPALFGNRLARRRQAARDRRTTHDT
jgi:hypothetical protein